MRPLFRRPARRLARQLARRAGHRSGCALSLTFAAILALTACGGPVISRIDAPVPQRFEAYYSGFAAGKELFVTVRGTPFGGGERAFGEKVLALLKTPSWLTPPARITLLSPPASAEEAEDYPAFRIVLLFGAPYTVAGREACRREWRVPVDETPLPPGGRVTVQGAVCYEDSAISEAEGFVDNVTGPDDPRFHSLISQLSTSMMQPERGMFMPQVVNVNTR